MDAPCYSQPLKYPSTIKKRHIIINSESIYLSSHQVAYQSDTPPAQDDRPDSRLIYIITKLKTLVKSQRNYGKHLVSAVLHGRGRSNTNYPNFNPTSVSILVIGNTPTSRQSSPKKKRNLEHRLPRAHSSIESVRTQHKCNDQLLQASPYSSSLKHLKAPKKGKNKIK